ncbi:isopeptide-forming domain-containing fimbrial protein, partial [Tyzzerella sp. OttesenSCG-928-J15]|nr:isopeptide-forming domain-containing fimbrial protein [Tyzzerella sp. OttesenSCG-928-J15]
VEKGITYNYDITVTIPSNISDFESLAISDQLDDFLEIVSAPSVTFDGDVIMGYGRLTWSTSSNLVRFDFNDGFDYSRIAGAVVKISIPARIRANVSDSDIIYKYGDSMRIPNVANLIFNGGDLSSNTVYVYPPGAPPPPPPGDGGEEGENPPPTPVPPTYEFVDNGDGTYTVMDGDTPLGYVTKNPEEETIMIDDIIPYGVTKSNPKTGLFEEIKDNMALIGPSVLIVAAFIAYVIIKKRRQMPHNMN